MAHPLRAGTPENISDIALCSKKVVPKVGIEPTPRVNGGGFE